MNKLGALIRNRNLIVASHFEFEKCHRIHCKCLEDLRNAPASENLSRKYRVYKRCIGLSKRWHQKWPK